MNSNTSLQLLNLHSACLVGGLYIIVTLTINKNHNSYGTQVSLYYWAEI